MIGNAVLDAGKIGQPPPLPQKNNRPECWLCKKKIKTRVYFRGPKQTLPSHYRCLVLPFVRVNGTA